MPGRTVRPDRRPPTFRNPEDSADDGYRHLDRDRSPHPTLWRNRFDNPTYDMLTGKREDIVRRTDGGLKLACRIVLLDQAALGAPYLNVFM